MQGDQNTGPLPRWRAIARWCCAVGVGVASGMGAGGAAASTARAGPGDAATPTEIAASTASVLRAFTDVFTVPADLPLQPPLRQDAQRMGQAHVEQLRSWVAAWPAQIRAALPAGAVLSRPQLDQAMWSRFYNELTAWRLAAGTPGSGTVVTQAATLPARACRDLTHLGPWSELLVLAQALPPERRAQAMQAELQLLQRWGRWPEPPPIPPVSLDDQTRNLAADPPGTSPPMAPALAAVLFSTQPAPLSPRQRCLARLWRLQAALAAGLPNDAAWAAYVYASAPKADSWSDAPAGAAAGEGEYPTLARRFVVQGTVLVEVQVDAKGQILGSRIANRKLTAMEQAGVRPLAFETLLDEASLKRAARVAVAPPPAADLKNGVALRRLELVWRLD